MEIAMKRINILLLTVVGLSGLSMGVNNAISKNDNELPAQSADAIMNAQSQRQIPISSPEQKKTDHDRSDIFSASEALPSSSAFKNQADSAIFQTEKFFQRPSFHFVH